MPAVILLNTTDLILQIAPPDVNFQRLSQSVIGCIILRMDSLIFESLSFSHQPVPLHSFFNRRITGILQNVYFLAASSRAAL